jgi:hypothetical protein
VFYDHHSTKEKKETTATNIAYAQLLAFVYIWYADFLISICLADKYFFVNPQGA